MFESVNSDFHEVWWIYAPERHPWGGARIAHFRKTVDGTMIVTIPGEADPRRVGVRVWDDISPREGWVKVRQIPLPTKEEVASAIREALEKIADDIKSDAGFDEPISRNLPPGTKGL